MFDQREVQKVLDGLRRRYPLATEADALAILQDAEWALADERAYEARDGRQLAREFDGMAAQ